LYEKDASDNEVPDKEVLDCSQSEEEKVSGEVSGFESCRKELITV